MTPPITNSRQNLLQQVITGIGPIHSILIQPNINAQPLLFFNDPLTAEFATFGVNPAAAELTWNRWPNANMTLQELDDREIGYFNNSVPTNDWFDGYERPPNTAGPEKALNLLGHSYRTDTVHLDFSPQATIPRTTAAKKLSKPDYKLFVQELRKMVAADLKWFLQALALCTNVKAAIMAGSITNDRRDYLDNFLLTYLPQPLYSLTPRQLFPNPQSSGAITTLYDLTGPGLNIPVLFVSAGPSSGSGDDKGKKLAEEVQRNLTTLKAQGFC